MKQPIFTFLVFFFIKFGVYAQNVGVNATGATPNTSAMLDISATNKGLLIPRVSLTGITDATTITTPATSLLVYNTNAALPDGKGYYYNSGTSASPSWVKFFSGSQSNDWKLLGNAGTTPGTNFLGTTDAKDLTIYTNNSERMRISSGGDVGIGAASLGSRLLVRSATIGQSPLILEKFDGTSLVTVSGVGNITVNGNTTVNTTGNGNLTFQTGTTGEIYMGLDYSNLNGGNVGIGTTTPAYKLHTKGDIYANGGWFRVSGNQGLYFESYGGGFNMIDNTWIRTYGNKNFYHNTGIMRTDGTFQVGNAGATFQVVNGGGMTYKDGTQGTNKVLTSDATGNASWQNPNNLVNTALEVPTGVQVFTASGTFTVPAGVTYIKVITGGGGGGATGKAGGSCSGGIAGGGSGGVSYAGISVTPGSTHTVVVGTGGIGCNSWTCTAGSGTASSFDGTVVAGGGGGGHFTTAGAGGTGNVTGNPGVNSGDGGDGVIFDFNTGERGANGGGSNSYGGIGGGQGISGGGGGAGRAGGSCSSTRVGGKGGRGSVVIMW